MNATKYEQAEDSLSTERMFQRMRNKIITRFDDVEVLFPDDPQFSAYVPGDSKIIQAARAWATERGQALLVGVQGDCPHALMNHDAVDELLDACRLRIEHDLDTSIILKAGHLESCDWNDREICEYASSLDHASFWVDSRWPTSPILRWFPYGDPAEHFPRPESDEAFELMRSKNSPWDGLDLTVKNPDQNDPGFYFENWYGHGSFLVEAKTGGPLHERQSLALRNAYHHALLMHELRRRQ